MVYEYRTSDRDAREDNKYRFKVGVSLLDVGSISYKTIPDYSGGFEVHIPANEQFNLDRLNGDDVYELADSLRMYPQYFTESPVSGSYKVSMPTSLHIDADVNLYKGFYVALAGQFNMAKREEAANPFYYNAFSVVPRFETKHIGVYVPLTFNELTDFNAGVSLRLGPLYIGSGSVLTALMDKTKQADVHLGLRFGIMHNDKVKTKKVKTTEEADASEVF